MLTKEERRQRQREYYQKNRDRYSEYNRRYYRDYKRYLSKYHKERYKKVKDARAETMRQYYARNAASYAEEQAAIKTARVARGWSQKKLAEKIGVTAACICHYEFGRVKAPWDKLIEVMPELKEAIKNG